MKLRTRVSTMGASRDVFSRLLLVTVSTLIAAAPSGIAAEAPAPKPLKAPFNESTAKDKQQEWARYLKREVVEKNSLGEKMVLVPPGEFMMGSPETEDGRLTNEEQHGARITKAFYLGVYDVTLGEFLAFYHASGYKTEAEADGKGGWGFDPANKHSQKSIYTFLNWGKKQANNHPVVNVSWNDAVAFCQWLSHKDGKTYRLPTEAEWEYACRAGTTTAFHYGDSLSSKEANFDGSYPYGDAADGPYVENTTAVGSYRPNAFGLYDMHGNVWQWCHDWYGTDYYKNSPTDDPRGSSADSERVLRGCGWIFQAVTCRSAYRYHVEPSGRFCTIGFRVVCEP